MHEEILRIRDKMAALQEAMDQFSAGNRDQLFDSRDLLREVADRVAGSAWKHATPLCEAVQKLLGNVLRHGGLTEQDSIELAGELLSFVNNLLDQPAPALVQPKLTHGSAALANTTYGQHAAFETRGEAVKVNLGMVDETRIGEILVRLGRISDAQLNQALALQQVCRKRLGEVLVSMGVIDDQGLEMALEEQRQITLRMANDLASNGGLELKLGHLGGPGA